MDSDCKPERTDLQSVQLPRVAREMDTKRTCRNFFIEAILPLSVKEKAIKTACSEQAVIPSCSVLGWGGINQHRPSSSQSPPVPVIESGESTIVSRSIKFQSFSP